MNKIKNIIVSRFAEDDLNEIIGYYDSLSHSYVAKNVKLFESNILSLREFPMHGRIVPELSKHGITRYRELIQGYYRIIYKISKDKVIVLTVIDGRRNFEEIIIEKLSRYL